MGANVTRRMARILIAACVLSLAAIARAQDEIEIFDAHLHYNWEPQPFYSLEQVLTIFRRNKVTGILSASRAPRIASGNAERLFGPRKVDRHEYRPRNLAASGDAVPRRPFHRFRSLHRTLPAAVG